MYPTQSPPALRSQAPFLPWGGKGARRLNTTPSSAPSTLANYGGPVGPAVVAASAVFPEADCLQGWYGSVNLLNDVCHHSEECTKVGMRKKCTYQRPLEGKHRCVAKQLWTPTCQFHVLFFSLIPVQDSPSRTQHDQRRLVPSALFPVKSDGLGKWSMLRTLIKNTIARATRKSTKLSF